MGELKNTFCINQLQDVQPLFGFIDSHRAGTKANVLPQAGQERIADSPGTFLCCGDVQLRRRGAETGDALYSESVHRDQK